MFIECPFKRKAFPVLKVEISSYHTSYEMFIRAKLCVLLDFSLTVKAATLIFISGCGSAISSASEGKSGFIYNLGNS